MRKDRVIFGRIFVFVYFYIIFLETKGYINMITKIELKDMTFYAYHGAFTQERKVGNVFVVNLEITAPLSKAVESDDLNDTINYAEVYDIIKKEMNVPSNLLEHLAGRIMNSLKVSYPDIEHIVVKLSKQNPPFGGDIKYASVILEENYK